MVHLEFYSLIWAHHDVSQQPVVLVCLRLRRGVLRRVGPEDGGGAGLVPAEHLHHPPRVQPVQLGDQLKLGAEGQAVLLLLLGQLLQADGDSLDLDNLLLHSHISCKRAKGSL